MIVDDSDAMRSLLRVILRNDDYEVVGEASNGEQGVEMALRLLPDVICLDVVMPKLGGLEALQQLREQLPKAKVLMVTGNADRETVEAAVRGGAAGFIVKPFNAARVLDSVRAALTKTKPS